MTGLSNDDFEDQLDNFIIRKPREEQRTYSAARKESKSGQKIHDHIPLLVGDILRSTAHPEDEAVFTLSNPSTLNYRTCLVYGYVAGRGVHNKHFHKYFIDDGTGLMEISISIKPKEQKVITNLHNEAAALVSTSELNYKKISSIMIRLLSKAMEYIDGSSILPGSNIMLFGRPNVYRNTISLDIISFTVDNERSRKLELAFSDCLLDYYQSYKNK
ncbi:uncharacterized protein LOC117787184 [Drosophila innubila]|uniref:uncharacterized protein LOC117787184 n=1 Tax=Drosophila innubila TaxID=198719 RepID=UPI00148E7C5E|nr:uncharacterized protein LOC117787184 [Drosophila innubila]